MKVRVSYAADINEVPNLINDLLNKMSADLKMAANKLTFNPNNFENMAKDLYELKETLSLVDSRVEDVVNLTKGWIDATTPKEESVETEDELAEKDASND